MRLTQPLPGLFVTAALAAASLCAILPEPAAAQPAAVQQPAVRLDVPYVPTPPAVVKRMLELAKVTKDDFHMDLGCGDGRIAVMAAKDFGARSLGIDIDPKRIEEANANAKDAGVSDRATFRQANLFETKIADASVLTMYLLPSVNLQLRPRILSEMKPGTRVVSHAFTMGDWTPDHQEQVEGRNVMMWIVPAQIDGGWTVKQGDTTFTVNVKQQYQTFTGTAKMQGQDIPITDGRIDGTQISFRADLGKGAQTFTGQVDGNSIKSGDGPAWTATRT